MDLRALIERCRRVPGSSLRTMEERARAAGHSISRSTINAYERGEISTQPSRSTVAALAAALGVSYDEVAAAASETFALDGGGVSVEGRRAQRAEAWLRLTEPRTDAEVDELLVIVEQVLRMRDMEGPPDVPNTG